MEDRSTPAPRHVEVFAIGTELVMGRIYDTNSFWIAEQLARLGTWPRRILCLPDDDDEVVRAFTDTIERGTDIVITTGGLGPTPDDRTLDCICRVAGIEQVIHRPTIESFVQRRNVPDDSHLTPALRKMAMVPVGSTVYQNPAGWAPLIALPVRSTTFYMMPGPPREMQALWTTHLEGILKQVFRSTTASRRVWVTMFESEVSPHIQQVMKTYPNTYLKAYVALRTETTLPVDVVAHGPDPAAAEATLTAALQLLGELVRGRGKQMWLDGSPPEG
ncbi:MAG TPA: competence/damage-inducible protein A [Chloroflexota bacterium]|nr:competence/damage-inducible protein A [Chloroflexota bacterium]